MVKFYIANDDIHKYVAVFDNPHKIVKFGAFGYEDYTQHGNKIRKESYLKRHKAREDWTDPRTAGTLSRYLLWNKPTLEASIEDYIKRFNMYETQ